MPYLAALRERAGNVGWQRERSNDPRHLGHVAKPT